MNLRLIPSPRAARVGRLPLQCLKPQSRQQWPPLRHHLKQMEFPLLHKIPSPLLLPLLCHHHGSNAINWYHASRIKLCGVSLSLCQHLKSVLPVNDFISVSLPLHNLNKVKVYTWKKLVICCTYRREKKQLRNVKWWNFFCMHALACECSCPNSPE